MQSTPRYFLPPPQPSGTEPKPWCCAGKLLQTESVQGLGRMTLNKIKWWLILAVNPPQTLGRPWHWASSLSPPAKPWSTTAISTTLHRGAAPFLHPHAAWHSRFNDVYIKSCQLALRWEDEGRWPRWSLNIPHTSECGRATPTGRLIVCPKAASNINVLFSNIFRPCVFVFFED